jgi:hypothetical protein
VKTIQILLSLYFLLLAGIPCVDAETAHSNRTTTEHSGDEHQDLCPPFCTCNCCGTFALSQFQLISCELWNPHGVAIGKMPEYQPVFVSAFFGNIWQPPKISA